MLQTTRTLNNFEDMFQYAKQLVKIVGNEQLSVEEWDLIDEAYENVTSSLCTDIRALKAILDNPDSKQSTPYDAMGAYKTQLESKLSSVCHDILKHLEQTLIPNYPDYDETRVMYIGMAGDYYRYLAEEVNDENVIERTGKMYANAYNLAKVVLAPTSPVRLQTALNYSNHLYKYKDGKKEALNVATAIIDKAEECEANVTHPILQIIQNNLTKWSCNDNTDGECNKQLIQRSRYASSAV
jgi:hypothetical protein